MSSVPLEVWETWTAIVISVLTMFVLLYFPLALGQAALLVRWLVRPAVRDCLPAKVSRKIAVVICTNGKAVAVVDYLLSTIRGYGLPEVGLYVIKEAYDTASYRATEIRVPKEFTTKNGSWTKERALQYGVEWGRAQGWGAETYVVHLDDDSLVTKEYLQFVLGMEEEAGQGSLRLRAHGIHLMSTLADMVRVSDCNTWCRLFNERDSPKAVHGEGLAIRADVEQRIGWDYATYCGEDFIFGQEMTVAGYRFAHIPYDILIAPPITARDFLKQRRRWTWGIFAAWSRVAKLSRTTMAWVLYRYSVGWTGFAGFYLFVYSVMVHIQMPLWLEIMATANLVVYFAYYQVAAMKTELRYMPLMFALQFPVAFYEGIALPYAVLFPPDQNKFETIEKT